MLRGRLFELFYCLATLVSTSAHAPSRLGRNAQRATSVAFLRRIFPQKATSLRPSYQSLDSGRKFVAFLFVLKLRMNEFISKTQAENINELPIKVQYILTEKAWMQ